MTNEELQKAFEAGYAAAKALYSLLEKEGIEVTEADIRRIVEEVIGELAENGQIGGLKQSKTWLFPEQKNVLVDIGDGSGAGLLMGTTAELGETPPPKIHIVIDGVEYERENIPDDSRPTTTGIYGNGGYLGGVGANNDNFAVMLNMVDNSVFALFIDPETQQALSAGATVTFGIYTQTETITPIDQKYLTSGGWLPVVELSTVVPFGVEEPTVLSSDENKLVEEAFKMNLPIVIRIKTLLNSGSTRNLSVILYPVDGGVEGVYLFYNSWQDFALGVNYTGILLGIYEGEATINYDFASAFF